ncbi:MAG: glutathione S-transferase family protein [Pseudorhodobacter sp.]|nr:glutathione S-transferase family protein [Rhizobacter sp.]
MQLYIGNKNCSSWSMRPWVLMKQTGIAFAEVMVRFDSFQADSKFKATLSQAVGSGPMTVATPGKVPLLVDNGFVVWDTLAIAEYLAEKFPELHLWPADMQARARARSVCAEMHSGFSALRSHFPMNIEAHLPDIGARMLAEKADARADLARIVQMWTDLLGAHGGPFLFGHYSTVDAYFAPVVKRIVTYALPVPPPVSDYVAAVEASAGVVAWTKQALAEHDFIDFDEPYRKSGVSGESGKSGE